MKPGKIIDSNIATIVHIFEGITNRSTYIGMNNYVSMNKFIEMRQGITNRSTPQ